MGVFPKHWVRGRSHLEGHGRRRGARGHAPGLGKGRPRREGHRRGHGVRGRPPRGRGRDAHTVRATASAEGPGGEGGGG